MAFNMNAAMSGAGTGAALGPYGAVAGGLLGGFFGGADEPEMYTAAQYGSDIKPYQQMVDSQMQTAIGMQNPNSFINRQFTQNTMNQSMDMMGTSNILNQRSNAANPYINTSGVNQQQQQNSLLQYANQGLMTNQKGLQDRFNQGNQVYQNAMGHQADISMSLAELNAGNIGTMNQFNANQQAQGQQGAGMLAGFMGGQFKSGEMFGKGWG